jgi:tetratricopeptide (TPR) repeat protein
MAAVAIYGALAGFHSLNDLDVWWQMASGRYMLENGHVMRTEVFSYTAQGEPWTYPIGAGILFHWLYKLGGFTLLSLLSPLIGGSITLLLVCRGRLLRCWMVALAVPSIAAATLVRANMFTTLFAAIYVTILWGELNRDDGLGAGGNIWILPPLMLLWVNLHPGFIYGLALVMAFAILRPRRLAMCALLTLLATLVNPWTWHIYEAILAQGGVMSAHTQFIGEWKRTPVSWTVLQDWLNGLEPDNHLWWLMAMALVGGMAGLFAGAGCGKRRWGGLLLLGSVAAAVAYTRFQGLSAVAAAIVAPDLLMIRRSKEASGDSIFRYLPLASATVLLALISWRGVDLATGRYYHTHATVLAHFGPGAAEWAPDRAAHFIEEHHLPRQLYADYPMGGYLTWRLGPLGNAPLANQDDARANRYPVFIDGRDLPYGLNLHFQQEHMSTETFDAPDWQMALEGWKVRTILVSTDPFIGYKGAPFSLLCQSSLFRLAYLDDTAAVFVKASEMTTPALDCRTVQLTPPAESAPSIVGMGDRYHFWVNAGWLYYNLGRLPEALEAFDRARAIFDGDAFWYQMYGLTLAQEGRLDEAEKYLRYSIALRLSPQNIDPLAILVSKRGHYKEAMDLYKQSAARAGSDAWNEWLFYSETALNARSAQDALWGADRALEEFPFVGAAAPLGTLYSVRLQRVRGIALLALDQPAKAADALQQAADAAPAGSLLQETLYLWLTDASYRSGRRSDARLALDRSKALAATREADGPNNKRRKELEELLNAKP